jgi:hypothetical protein
MYDYNIQPKSILNGVKFNPTDILFGKCTMQMSGKWTSDATDETNDTDEIDK